MKYIFLKKIPEFIKYIIVKFLIYGIIIGIITGLMVTYLFYIPKISLTNTFATIKDDKIYFEFKYENKGESPAINIEYIKKYAIIHKNENIHSDVVRRTYDKHEAGDIVMDMLTIDSKIVGKDIFENSEIIILCKAKYDDISKFRNFINKILLRNHYSIYRLTFYDVSKKEKYLSMLTLEKRNEFKEIIDEWIEE